MVCLLTKQPVARSPPLRRRNPATGKPRWEYNYPSQAVISSGLQSAEFLLRRIFPGRRHFIPNPAF
jgi:hypothetical protein